MAGFDETFRSLERGSRIVTCVPDGIQLVLQMPRGNLETICPRSLVLTVAREYLAQQQYRPAFVLLRKHRVNLNLLADHDPAALAAHTQDFVRALDSAANVNLFLADLKDEDCTVTMYYNQDQAQVVAEALRMQHGQRPGKVARVCAMIRAAAEAVDPWRLFHAILMSHAKEGQLGALGFSYMCFLCRPELYTRSMFLPFYTWLTALLFYALT